MKTLNINEKINTKSWQSRSREIQHDIKNNYHRTVECKNSFGNHGGGVWEYPSHQIWQQQMLHLTPRICPD